MPDTPAMLPTAPQATSAPAPPGQGAAVTPPPPTGTPAQVYRGLRAQREILGDQLDEAMSMRSDLVRQLQEPNVPNATRASLEKRITNLDARVTDLDQQIARSDQAVANAAAVPGATTPPPQPPRQGPPEEAYVVATVFMFIVLLPLSIAYARRVWRRSAAVEVRIPPEMTERMAHLERGVEAIALEVERIGEGQRFLTQAMVDRGSARAVRAGEPVPVRNRADDPG